MSMLLSNDLARKFNWIGSQLKCSFQQYKLVIQLVAGLYVWSSCIHSQTIPRFISSPPPYIKNRHFKFLFLQCILNIHIIFQQNDLHFLKSEFCSMKSYVLNLLQRRNLWFYYWHHSNKWYRIEQIVLILLTFFVLKS